MLTLIFVVMFVLALIFWGSIWRLITLIVNFLFKFERE